MTASLSRTRDSGHGNADCPLLIAKTTILSGQHGEWQQGIGRCPVPGACAATSFSHPRTTRAPGLAIAEEPWGWRWSGGAAGKNLLRPARWRGGGPFYSRDGGRKGGPGARAFAAPGASKTASPGCARHGWHLLCHSSAPALSLTLLPRRTRPFSAPSLHFSSSCFVLLSRPTRRNTRRPPEA